MAKKRVAYISTECLPMRAPINSTLICILMADYYHLTDLYKGVMYAILFMSWITFFYTKATTYAKVPLGFGPKTLKNDPENPDVS